MRKITRVLVLDGDVGHQAEVQQTLLRRSFIVAGSTDNVEETAAIAQAVQPNVLLVNLDNPGDLAATMPALRDMLADLPAIGFSTDRNGATHHVAGLRIVRRLTAPIRESDLLAAIESALAAPADASEPAPGRMMAFPLASLIEVAEARPEPERQAREAAVEPDERRPVQRQPRGNGANVLSPAGDRTPVLARLAELVSDWTRAPSTASEKALMDALSEDVSAPAFGGRGRDVVKAGLESLASALGSLMAVMAERDGRPVVALLRERGWAWESAGHFVVGLSDEGLVSSFDYRAEEPEAQTRDEDEAGVEAEADADADAEAEAEEERPEPELPLPELPEPGGASPAGWPRAGKGVGWGAA